MRLDRVRTAGILMATGAAGVLGGVSLAGRLHGVLGITAACAGGLAAAWLCIGLFRREELWVAITRFWCGQILAVATIFVFFEMPAAPAEPGLTWASPGSWSAQDLLFGWVYAAIFAGLPFVLLRRESAERKAAGAPSQSS